MDDSTIYTQLLDAKRKGLKKFVVLIDPDKIKVRNLTEILQKAVESKVDYFFIGGSLLIKDRLNHVIDMVKTSTNIPSIIFPGNVMQIHHDADALLFLSLISGRNPELLIGQHVLSAPKLVNSGLEVISTGYMLIDGGTATSVQYMSNTQPIPRDKPEIAMCTALAGKYLGMKLIYMDAGSGAKYAIPTTTISEVSQALDIPLIVGGGLNTVQKVNDVLEAGADIVVVGNAIEKTPSLIYEIATLIQGVNTKKVGLDLRIDAQII